MGIPRIGAAAAKFAEKAPEQEVPVDLKRFKQWLEAGEIPPPKASPPRGPRTKPPPFKYNSLSSYESNLLVRQA